MTTLQLEADTPDLGAMVDGLAVAPNPELEGAFAGAVERWLRQRTDGWEGAKLALLRDQLRELLHAERLDAWRESPALWAREVLGVHLWSKQREILTSARENMRTAVPSCHGAGKTFTAAVLAAWWLSVHPAGEAFVVSTAPTFAQVRAVLWREINRLHKSADLPGRVNQTEWHLDGELVGFGRKPADTDQSAFQGIHAKRVLVLLDEAGGVPEQLWTAADSVATNDLSRIVAFGNPDDPSAHFAKVCADGNPLWHRIRISAFDTPNLTGEQVPQELTDVLVTARWVRDRETEWGTDNPLYVSKVLGQFPTDDALGAVRLGDVEACRREPLELAPHRLLPVELGVDIGGGGDLTSIRARHGARVGRKWEGRTPDPQDVIDLVLRSLTETPGVTAVKLDAGGIGWGVVNDLKKTLRERGLGHVRVVPINFGAAATEPERYKNKRAELWWGIGREWSQQRAWDLHGLDDDTVAQLVAPRWHEDGAGRIVIEPKDEVIKRLGRSPDDADALLLAFARGVVAAASLHVPQGVIPTGASAQGRR